MVDSASKSSPTVRKVGVRKKSTSFRWNCVENIGEKNK